MPKVTDARLLVGHATFDDAGVYLLDDERALVQTVDFFPPVVDDPFVYGQVAAANSLSDIYAMGGTPLTAMSIVGFPLDDLPLEWLGEILKGGQSKVTEAGAVIVGGHSVKDPEVKFGLSVTGLVHPRRIASNAGAKPGDRLVLTKPLGMGPVTTAYRKHAIAAEQMKRATDQMAALNRSAAEAMAAVGINAPEGVHAATDVTGFGLLGHARNVADASGVTLRFMARALPVFEGALDFAAKKMVSRAMKQNEELLAASIEVSSAVPEALRRVVFDSETSGGLLIAVAPGAVGKLLDELKRREVMAAAEVGTVEARGSHLLRLE